MRKKYLLVVFSLITTFTAFSQSKLGLKFSPVISTTRTSLIDSTYNVNPQSSAFKFSLGLIYDHEITETYFFSTGLIFLPKQIGVTVENEPGKSGTLPKEPSQTFNLNYLQIPISLKLFTNEIQPDTRVYFQVGMAPEIKVFSQPTNENYDLVKDFRNFDTSVIFGGGIEYRAGVNTTLFGGITYQRGLINALKTANFNFQEQLYLRSTILSFDLGIKF